MAPDPTTARPLALCLCLCLAVGLVVWMHRRHPTPSPWPKAVLIEPSRGVIPSNFIPSGYDYFPRFAFSWFWRSTSTLACLQQTGAIPNETIEIHLDTGLVDRHPTFMPLPTEQPEAELFYWSVSPNGRFILTIARDGRDRIYTAASFDGIHRLEWTHPYESRSEPEWLNDSSGFVEWPVRDGQALVRIHWIDSGAALELALEDLPVTSVSTPAPLPQPFVVMSKSVPPPGATVELLVLSPSDNLSAWHRVLLLPPPPLAGKADLQVIIAPSADCLLWLCHEPSRFPSPARQPLFPFVSFHPQFHTTLLLSRPDGSQLTVLGRTRRGITIDTAQWAPDSRHLGFFYEGVLWTATVDP